MRSPIRFLATAALSGAALLACARDARADNVSPTGKGIAGGALLGGEVITIGESLVGVHAGWAYGVGAAVGAIGGGVGGYFIEQGSADGKVPIYMLAGGLALVIPAVVLTLNATRYMPEEGATEDKTPVGPAAEPGAAGGSVVTPAAAPAAAPAPPAPAPAPAPPPQSLLDLQLDRGVVRIGVPVPDVRPVFSPSEERALGVTSDATELRMPVLRVAF